MMHPPTKRQRQLEKVLKEMTAANDGVAPSYPELAERMGLSHGAIRSLAIGLCARGRATRVPGKPRTLALIKEGETAQ